MSSFIKVSSLLLPVVSAASIGYATAGQNAGCTAVQGLAGGSTFLPNTTAYDAINTDYYTTEAWLGPACIYEPTSSKALAKAVAALAKSKTPFAIRSGGHMPIADAANINSEGVLLATSGLKTIELSADKASVKVGAGNRWNAVYDYLKPTGLSVVGGRLGVIGVSGFTLGGGISFLSSKYGWASSNVVQYDVILANGAEAVVTATNEHKDLFWALRAGGSNFALVTAFHLKTYPLPVVAIGSSSYTSNVTSELFLDSLYGFAVNGSADSNVALVPQAFATPEGPSYSAFMFNDGNNTHPPSLHNYTTAMTARTSSYGIRNSISEWTTETDAGFNARPDGRSLFYLHPLRADREAIQVVHDTFFSSSKTHLNGTTGVSVSLAVMIITESFARAAQANGGDPGSLDPSLAPYIWIQEVWSWTDPALDSVAKSSYDKVHADITAQLDTLKNDARHPFIHLNHAGEGQPVFEGYPKASLERLEAVRRKYDPTLVFTKLLRGGWKFNKAHTRKY